MSKAWNCSFITLTLALVLAIVTSVEAPPQLRQASQLTNVGPSPGPFNPAGGPEEQTAQRREG